MQRTTRFWWVIWNLSYHELYYPKFVCKNGTKIWPVQNFSFLHRNLVGLDLAPRASRQPPPTHAPNTNIEFPDPYVSFIFRFHRPFLTMAAAEPPWLAISPISATGRIIVKTVMGFWIIVKNWFCLLESTSLDKRGGQRACVCTPSIFVPFLGTKIIAAFGKMRK